MKNLKLLLSLLVLAALSFNSCTDSIDDLVTEDVAVGGLVDVNSQLINYVIGTPEGYEVSLTIPQGEVKTQSIDVYKSFTGLEGNSNRVLLKNIPVEATITAIQTFTISFGELIDGLAVNDTPLSSDDTSYNIGDFWTLEYEAKTSEGNTALNRNTTKVSVATRLAGIYSIVVGEYIHPSTAPDVTSNYAGQTRIIESVNPDTYLFKEIGPWTDQGNQFYFKVTEDNQVVVLKEWDGATQLIWGADELANCADNPNELSAARCVNTAELVESEEDVITVSYGYIRTSGTRQFNEVLVKIK